MYAKAIRWETNHTDKYIYDRKRHQWIRAGCTLNQPGMHCTAPHTLPRGTQFDYNCRLTDAEEYATHGMDT